MQKPGSSGSFPVFVCDSFYAAALAALSACGSASEAASLSAVLPASSLAAAASEDAASDSAGVSPPVARMASCTSLSAIMAGSEAVDAAVDSGFVSLSVRPVRYQLPLWRLNR